MKVTPLEKKALFFFKNQKKKTLSGQALKNVSGVFTARS